MESTNSLVDAVKTSRVYSHPFYEHWAAAAPTPDVSSALFHQVQKFCASTRPAGVFPEALRSEGFDNSAGLLDEIVESESGHGPELATMAGHVINCSGAGTIYPDVYATERVEAGLKQASDRLLGQLPGYDPVTGHTAQAEAAIAVFRRRYDAERETTMKNLGTALALEIISNQSLIPGEKAALVDSGHYGVKITDPEMHYLEEHWGECGAEQQHEKNVIAAVDALLTRDTADQLTEGVQDFLITLGGLWDVLDAALLNSGLARQPSPVSSS